MLKANGGRGGGGGRIQMRKLQASDCLSSEKRDVKVGHNPHWCGKETLSSHETCVCQAICREFRSVRFSDHLF